MKKNLYNTENLFNSVATTYEENNTGSGWFSLIGNSEECDYENNIWIDYLYPTGWYHCRETFLNHYFLHNTARFMFSHGVTQGPLIANFIYEVEKKLGLKTHSTISGFKNKKGRSLIQPSKWWRQQAIRRQLLTILLRCGRSRAKDFNKILFSNAYIKDSPEAVERFFKGYTKFDGKMTGFIGWGKHFCHDQVGSYELNLNLKKMYK